jgi:hypothetical protein
MLRVHRLLVSIAAIALAACAIAVACAPPRWQRQPPKPVTSSSTRPPTQTAEAPYDDGGVPFLDPSRDASASVIIDARPTPPTVPARLDPTPTAFPPPPPAASPAVAGPMRMRSATPPPDAPSDATLPPVPDGGLVRDAGTPL